jgi:4-amino-4-deoxy-L-arabinose transferase-like glycosyltransferase
VGSSQRAVPVAWAWRVADPILVTTLGGFGSFAIMAADRQWRWGIPVGAAGIVVAALGMLALSGSFRAPDASVAKSTRLSALAPWVACAAAALFVTMKATELACRGRLGVGAAAVAMPATFLALVTSAFRVGVALGPLAVDERGATRPLLQRHGFWVVAAGTFLYLPALGSFSLIDPWETHYGEVARGMLARADWISTWTPQSGWFWSKPVLDIWMQALAMGALGAGYLPGQMLAGAESGFAPRPEWAVRLPVFLLSILALYALYKAVARMCGRRAGLLGALVLATTSQWFLIAHQSITDMPLVATLSISMSLLLLALSTEADRLAPTYEITVVGRCVRLGAHHLVLGMLLLTVLPQLLYLASRNVELVWVATQHGFRPHLDEFWSGSKGNCDLPGNAPCTYQLPAHRALQPILQALGWALVLGVLVAKYRSERRVRCLYLLAAWYFAGVAMLGKGPAGLALPAAVGFAYIGTTAKWRQLASLQILNGLSIVAVVAVPWYVAMFARHGHAFTDELIFHHMWKRALDHVHDMNAGDDVSFRYYVWQLCYALFPWTGLSAAALVWWRANGEPDSKEDMTVFFAMWFVLAFGLFTAMPTKFHHYIFPAVPPAAILTGIALDRMLGEGPLARRPAPYVGTVGGGAVVSLYGCLQLFFQPSATSFAPWSGGALAVAGLFLAWFGARKFGLSSADDDGFKLLTIDASKGHEAKSEGALSPREHDDMLIGAMAVSGAILVALVGRDLVVSDGDVRGESRLLGLFTYNYHRAWPSTLDFRGPLAGVAFFAGALTMVLALRPVRRHAVAMLLAGAFGYAAWALDIYLVRCASHWGQREIFEAYYRSRASKDEPIIAYRMNWLGEYFYSSNRIPAFGIGASDGASIARYLKGETQRGTTTFYFVTEHASLASLRSDIGTPGSFEKVTDARLNNKFVLVRATFDRDTKVGSAP